MTHPLDTKVTTKMPLVREDPDEAERNLPDPSTYRLVKQYVRQNEEKEAQEAEARDAAERTHNARYNAILRAVQDSGKELRRELANHVARLDRRIDDVELIAKRVERTSDDNEASISEIAVRVETLEGYRARVQKRTDFLAATAPGMVAPWDLGEVSDTGSHKVVSIADIEASRAVWDKKLDDALSARDKADKAEKWTKSVQWLVGIVGVVLTGVLVAVIVAALTAHPVTAPALSAPMKGASQ
jgi:hypothetical protein